MNSYNRYVTSYSLLRDAEKTHSHERGPLQADPVIITCSIHLLENSSQACTQHVLLILKSDGIYNELQGTATYKELPIYKIHSRVSHALRCLKRFFGTQDQPSKNLVDREVCRSFCNVLSYVQGRFGQ